MSGLKSTDGGKSWLPISCGVRGWMSSTLSLKMFLAPDDDLNFGLFKSEDGGNHWTPLSLPWSFPVNPTSGLAVIMNRLYLCLADTIFTSADFGNTWEKWGNNIGISGPVFNIMPLDEYPNYMFAASYNGVCFTSDRGNSWTLRNNGLPVSNRLIRNIGIMPDGILAYGDAGIFYSTDSGLSWKNFNSSFSMKVLTVSVKDTVVLAGTESGIFRVTPTSISNSTTGIYRLTARSLSSDPKGNVYYNTASGLYHSSNQGNKWTLMLPDSLPDGIREMAFKNNNAVFQSANNSFYRSSDYGKNWIKAGNPQSIAGSLAFSRADDILYAGFYNITPQQGSLAEGFYMSEDAAGSWTSLSSGKRFTHLVVLPGDTIYARVYDPQTGAVSGIYRKTGRFQNWVSVSQGLNGNSVKELARDNSDNLYALCSDGLYKLNKKNLIWYNISGAQLQNASMLKFNRLNHLLLIQNGKLNASVDGKKWELCSPAACKERVYDFCIDKDGYYYAMSINGELHRTSSPRLTDQLPEIPVILSPSNSQLISSDSVRLSWKASAPLAYQYSLRISGDSLFTVYKDALISATGHKLSGLTPNKKYYWKVKAINESGESEYSSASMFYTGTTSAENAHIKAFSYALRQNYPNPFNPVTHISYSVAKAGNVELKLYNVLGNEVMTLVNSFVNAGDHSTELNASLLPSGIYFYRITSGGFTDTKKMILLK